MAGLQKAAIHKAPSFQVVFVWGVGLGFAGGFRVVVEPDICLPSHGTVLCLLTWTFRGSL